MDLRQSKKNILDKLTEVMGVDIRFYGKSFTWLSFGQASGVLRGVATTFLMARWLPRATMGEFRYILAVFAIAGMFAAGGVGTGIIRGIAKGDTVIVWAGMKRILMMAPLGSLVLILAAIERWLVGETTVAIALIFSGIVFPIYAICGLYGSILTGQERIQRLTKIAIINNTFFALSFFIVIWRTKELLPIFFAYLGIDILFRGFLTWNEIRKLPKTGDAKEHINLGDHLSAIGIFQALASQLDQILIQRFTGYETLANFSIATLIPEQIRDFINTLNGIVLRRFSLRENSRKNLLAVRRHYYILTILTAVTVGLYIVAIPFILPWLFPQYANEVLASQVYVIGLLATPGLVGINFFQAHKNLKALWLYYSSNAVVQVICNILLIPFFGSWGAIWSKTISRLTSVPLLYPRSSQEEMKQ
jgi:O-antigen/teichoic acid export membrane protein